MCNPSVHVIFYHCKTSDLKLISNEAKRYGSSQSARNMQEHAMQSGHQPIIYIIYRYQKLPAFLIYLEI